MAHSCVGFMWAPAGPHCGACWAICPCQALPTLGPACVCSRVSEHLVAQSPWGVEGPGIVVRACSGARLAVLIAVSAVMRRADLCRRAPWGLGHSSERRRR